MSLRVIEVIAPQSDRKAVLESLEEHRPDEEYVFWTYVLENEDAVGFRIILQVEESENVLDKLEQMFTWTDEYRIVVYAAEATLPRLQTDPPPEEQVQPEENGDDAPPANHERISREELYNDVYDNARTTVSYLVLVALAATLGDTDLVRLSLRTLALGVGVVVVVSALCGMVFGLPAGSFEFLDRIHASYADIVLAVVSGTAGIVSVTLGTPTGLVGVMVALSLLPPLAACGMSLGAGEFFMALGAGALFVTNIICLNLAGVATFLIQGIQPLSWWERKRARGMVLRVGLLWTTMLAALCVLLYFRIV